MMIRTVTLAALLLAAAPASAAERNYSVSSFDRIRVDGPYRVTLTTGVSPFAKASGSNAGIDGAVVIQEVRRQQKAQNNLNIGYNVVSNEYTDMIKAGIPDPAKVTRGAVENAASIASMILTTEVLITDVPEKDKAPAAPPMPEY